LPLVTEMTRTGLVSVLVLTAAFGLVFIWSSPLLTTTFYKLPQNTFLGLIPASGAIGPAWNLWAYTTNCILHLFGIRKNIHQHPFS
jgi:hypothetical protein